MRILIFCPILKREWIVAQWLAHAAASAEAAGVEYSFLLVGGMDDPTFEVVDGLPQYNVARIYVDETRKEDLRQWPPQRFERLAELRNVCLRYIRMCHELDYALSCDSDVLLHAETIGNLIETQQEYGWDAVGGYCYLSANRRSPSYSALPAPHVLHRPDIAGQVQRTDVLMAIVLMTARAFAVDYQFARQGEDIGHAIAMKKAGLKVGIDARALNKHAMRPEDLNRVDQRIGW